ncbi:hypothetical protein QBC41DRAFT_328028 [Cercophora samala]|uniref:Uncharacterized protein n=1 Tax=Cercophora samala TaxID=330535 RepID=A0AA39Z6X5_9PEZI|nr:hypothetical protein QBC41DRAFT_328028 [Cercophora samala]
MKAHLRVHHPQENYALEQKARESSSSDTEQITEEYRLWLAGHPDPQLRAAASQTPSSKSSKTEAEGEEYVRSRPPRTSVPDQDFPREERPSNKHRRREKRVPDDPAHAREERVRREDRHRTRKDQDNSNTFATPQGRRSSTKRSSRHEESKPKAKVVDRPEYSGVRQRDEPLTSSRRRESQTSHQENTRAEKARPVHVYSDDPKVSRHFDAPERAQHFGQGGYRSSR